MMARSLGSRLREVKKTHKASLADLTVMSPQNDPFRLDTPANHIKGQWFRDQMQRCGLLDRSAPIHNRGIHYAIVSTGDAILPDGSLYVNDADCWAFLEEASNTARWLGYVAWAAIFDARNAGPVIQIAAERSTPYPIMLHGGNEAFHLPDNDDLRRKPEISIAEFQVRQPYHLVFFGEKTSLGTVLGPLADRYGADLYLPSGEISNTLLARMAQNGAEDGRPMIVLVFADCDPAGYQMAVSIGHKLRAMSESLYPQLRFRLIAPALTVEQVRENGLPSTPLKESEKRADGWRERYGIEQTEIDALATLRPALLQSIVHESVTPYFDATLQQRTQEEAARSVTIAQAEFDRLLDLDVVGALQSQAVEELISLRGTLAELSRVIDEIDVAVYLKPTPADLPFDPPPPLVASDMTLIEHIQTLKHRKDYSGGEA